MEEIFACKEHIEEALDDAVYGGFSLPVMDQLSTVDNQTRTCVYCKAEAIYIVTNKDSNTQY